MSIFYRFSLVFWPSEILFKSTFEVYQVIKRKSNPRKKRSTTSLKGGDGSKPINVNSRADKLREMYERSKVVRPSCPFDGL